MPLAVGFGWGEPQFSQLDLGERGRVGLEGLEGSSGSNIL